MASLPSVPTGTIDPSVIAPFLKEVNLISVIKPALTLLLCEVAFSSILLPLFFALFWFSTPELRRKPIFALNIVAMVMCLITGALSAALQVLGIIDPLRAAAAKGTFIASAIFCTYTPIYVEALLILRLLAVYPPSRLSSVMRAVIYLPPIAFTITRCINTAVTMHEVAEEFYKSTDVLTSAEDAWRSHGTVVEFWLQVFHNSYVSILFLSKVYHVQARANTWNANTTRSSYLSRLRTLFYIAATNFIFPVILSLAQLIFIYAKADYYAGIYMVLLYFTNDFFQVICLLLATIWVASSQGRPDGSSNVVASVDLRASRTYASRREFVSHAEPISIVVSRSQFTKDDEIALRSLEDSEAKSSDVGSTKS